MKKIIAILLLATQVFTLVGYNLVFNYFIHQSEQKFVQQLDEKKYIESDLVLISLPLNLPYMQNQKEFERIDGMVELKGVVYNYVKRRVYNDTLYILCLPNQQRNELVNAKSNYTAEVNDFVNTGTKKQKESGSKKTACNVDYDYHIINYHIALSSIIILCFKYNLASQLPPTATIKKPEHPPQFHC